MNNEFISYIIYLIAFWYISYWLLIFMIYNKKDKSPSLDKNFKEYNVARHVIFTFILIILLVNLFGLNN